MQLQTVAMKIPTWIVSVYFLVLSILFLCFQHTDLVHTFMSSYAYLDDHILDFYDYNKRHIGGNDYLPLIYWIFAVWNFPLHFFNLFQAQDFIGPSRLALEIFWSKLLLVLFFFASVKMLSLVSKEIAKNNHEVSYRLAPIVFASSPIAVLIVFAFGMYDIIGTFFVISAYYFYLKKNMWPFALIFSVAISFKYFAFVIYFPLILIVEKRPLYILKWLTVGWAVVFFQFILYMHSDIFLGEIFNLFRAKVIGEHQVKLSPYNPVFLTATFYSLGCIYLYLKKYSSVFEWHRDAVFAPIFAYGLMFSTVIWHPQWILIVMPFFALSYLFIANARLLIFLDILGAILFVGICVNFWPNNVDMNMIQRSILAQYLPTASRLGAEFLVIKPVQFLKPLFQMELFHIYLFLPMIVYFVENHSSKHLNWVNLTNEEIYLRFFMGGGGFLLLALLCIAWPKG